MNSDVKFWSIVWVCITVMVVAMSISLKHCNDTDNKFYTDAVSKGCSVLSCHNGHKIICSKDQEPRCE